MVQRLSEARPVLTLEHPEGTILVVEDEPLTRAKIVRALIKGNYQVVEAESGEQALASFRSVPVDLVVLDLLLPGMSGFEVCQCLRSGDGKTPIIMLTNLNEIQDRVRGLGMGADDYMVKPFYPEELVARVQAVLRRSKDLVPQDAVLEVGELKIEFHTQRAFKNGVDLELTHKEFQLLAELCASHGKPVSRATLLSRVWGENHFGSDKSLDVFVGRLRQKVETEPDNPTLIRTVRGHGYMCG